MTLPELLESASREGFEPGAAPTHRRAYDPSEAINVAIWTERSCPRCGHDGLEYRAFHRHEERTAGLGDARQRGWYRLREYGVCPACDEAEPMG